MTLMKLVLNNLHIHYFSFFKAPKIVIKENNKFHRAFLWGVKEGGRRINCLSWNKVCRDKKEGGLGVKQCEISSLTLMSKWIWRIVNDKESL